MTTPKFKRGDHVRKVSGSQWTGIVVGEYSTELTPEGYAVESSTERGSVQIYPAKALELAEQPAQQEPWGYLDERDACWRLCDALWMEGKDAHDCREAIRARGGMAEQPAPVQQVEKWPVSQDPLTHLQLACVIAERDAAPHPLPSIIKMLGHCPECGATAKHFEAQSTHQAAAVRTLSAIGYTYHGGEQWKPPLGERPAWLDDAEQPAPTGKTMYWDADDPESGPSYDIESLLNNVASNGDLEVGAEVHILRALDLPDMRVRVTKVPEDEDIEYVVVAPQPQQCHNEWNTAQEQKP